MSHVVRGPSQGRRVDSRLLDRYVRYEINKLKKILERSPPPAGLGPNFVSDMQRKLDNSYNELFINNSSKSAADLLEDIEPQFVSRAQERCVEMYGAAGEPQFSMVCESLLDYVLKELGFP